MKQFSSNFNVADSKAASKTSLQGSYTLSSPPGSSSLFNTQRNFGPLQGQRIDANGNDYTNYGFEDDIDKSPVKKASLQEMSVFDDRNGSGPGNSKKNSAIYPVTSANFEDASKIEEDDERGHWGSKAEFILSCVGFSVGIGNVWRFPYLAYQNGGGAFLLPYFILLVLVGKPLYYLETAMGQYARVGPLHLWRCAPIGYGVGIAMIILCVIVTIYYNVIMAYSVMYLGASFVGTYEELPWTYCDSRWNSNENCTSSLNITDSSFLKLERCYPNFRTENCTYIQTAATQYWERFVLGLTVGGLGDPGDLGGFKYDLPLALLFAWVIVFLCLMKGVKSSGKVVYFTATFPYVILIALLIRGCMLDGAVEGLKYLFIPDFEKLQDFNVWRKAAEQMFFSLGISWGGLMMFGSYNKFHNKVNIDASIVSSLDFITSIISSCVIFSVLGHLSKAMDVPIEHVAEGGQGLAFIAYPEALSRLPTPALWSILFFFMLFFLGLDSEFALLETVLTAFYDEFPKLREHKVKTTFVACSICYLLGLPCVSNSGQYVLDLMDTYGAGFAVLWVAIFELIGLMWIYGVRNVSRDFRLMLGSQPSWFWRICWTIISPIFLVVVFIASVVNWEEHKYAGVIRYPDWAHGIGWGLVAISAIQIPLWAFIMTIYYASKGKVWQVIKPTSKWGPGDKEARQKMLDELGGITSNGPFVYDNQTMESYHM